MLEPHQFRGTPRSPAGLVPEFRAAQPEERPGRGADMRGQRPARASVVTGGVVQQEFGDAARREPGKAAVIPQAPEGEAPVALEAVPAAKG